MIGSGLAINSADYIDEWAVAGEGVPGGAARDRGEVRGEPAVGAGADGAAGVAAGGVQVEDGAAARLRVLQQPLPVRPPPPSNITNISSIQNLSSTDESSFRNRFTEEFENSILNAAIKEVRANCTDETFDTVMGCVMNNKNKEYEEARRELDRKNKEC